MDSIWANIFWRAGGEDKFTSYSNRKNVCVSKDVGGLGVLNNRIKVKYIVGL
jgi:hypothetical protein